jgi:hypothetical protein
MAHQSNEPSRASPPSAIAARLAMGYIALQAVCVATKLGIAVLLSKGALTSSEIAQSTEMRPDAVHRLLRALAAFDTVKDLDSGFAGRRVFAQRLIGQIHSLPSSGRRRESWTDWRPRSCKRWYCSCFPWLPAARTNVCSGQIGT